MSTHTGTHPMSHHHLPAIRQVSVEHPWFWLAAGWRDFVRAPGISLVVGLLVTAAMVLGVSLLQPGSYSFLAAAIFAVTIFLGPVLAVGLYEVSRRMEHHKPVGVMQMFFGWMRNGTGVLMAGGVLLLILLSWYLLSMVLGTMLFGVNVAPDVATNMENIGMLFVFSVVGSIAMAIAFVLMVVSVPMLVDRPEIDIIVAMQSSIQVVRVNLGTMLVWAMLIALFTSLAVAPLFLGLSVVFPLMAYASWHAYRDLVVH